MSILDFLFKKKKPDIIIDHPWFKDEPQITVKKEAMVMDKNSLTFDLVKSVIDKKGYKFYTDTYDLNIVGIRTLDQTPNVFNDYLCILYKDENGANQIFKAYATTDPGTYWLENPMNVSGTALVKEGQWRSLWTPGIHKTYRALVQYSDITVYRDSDKDDIAEKTTVEETGNFGIDMHRSNPDGVSVNVDKWSAGCQVFASSKDFAAAMALVDKQIANGKGDKFTYTLLNEADF